MTTPTADPASLPQTPVQRKQEVEDLEIDLLLEGIWRRYGYELGEYDRHYIRLRLQPPLQRGGLKATPELQDRILRSPAALDGLLDGDEDESFDSFFKPARLWKALRRKAIPALRTYPSVRAW